MNRETLLNLLFRMIQLQITRSMDQDDKAGSKHSAGEIEGGNGEGRRTSADEGPGVEGSVDMGVAAQEVEGNRQSPNDPSGDGIGEKRKHEESSDAPTSAILHSSMKYKSAIENRNKSAWEEESKRHLAELDREREKQAISNQQKYGNLVMWIFILWLIFVGVIISVQVYILYQNEEVFSWWTTSVLIASPSGILVVVFRILFPPKTTSRRPRRKRRRK